MVVPKFLRRWKYKRILKNLAKQQIKDPLDPLFLCSQCRWRFPYVRIEHYPELWDRKHTAEWFNNRYTDNPYSQVWFRSNYSRKVYVEQALDLLTNKTK